MIDIENKVVDTVYRAVNAAYPNAEVEGGYNPTPDKFPYVTVVEIDNSMPELVQDNINRELYVHVFYEVNVYTNDSKKKSTAKAIADLVDDTMRGMKFLRTFRNQIPNIDRTIYRITMRYQAVVMAGTTTGDTTTYQLFHRI